MTRTKPRKSDNPKQNKSIEKSAEEKYNEFLILRNSHLKSLFAIKLRK